MGPSLGDLLICSGIFSLKIYPIVVLTEKLDFLEESEQSLHTKAHIILELNFLTVKQKVEVSYFDLNHFSFFSFTLILLLLLLRLPLQLLLQMLQAPISLKLSQWC